MIKKSSSLHVLFLSDFNETGKALTVLR